MLTSLSSVLQKAQKNHYAVGAFNVNNLEFIKAVVEAAEAEHSPVIISTSEGAIDYAGMEELGTIVQIVSKRTNIPIVFHLDHGKKMDLVIDAIESGFYTSIMFDGSTLSYEKNIKQTKELVKLAHKKKISVEAELGAIAGIEDFVSIKERDAHLTSPEQVVDFVKQTGCDALAIAIGTSHGAFKFKQDCRLDFKRLQEIRRGVNVPLVLHGASGVPKTVKHQCLQYGCKIEQAKGVSDVSIKKAVKLGITKVNIDTDLRIAFDAGIRSFLQEYPEIIDPRQIMTHGKELITKVVRQKIRLFGSSKRA
ncbi:fructose-1,6-bisphosphate aldolase, class II [Candidatus Uhrbacteria bacterium CG_4_9_14_3_um_filter_36_7]|uniref:Fructose-1,6-bisphosphate aldolase, class II n=1 Tax=Candidatus Uhrbacteria bacterium CG_4_9_14_3_um_filter_36_7 TaxID=1975033 RepID=A0A2M7XH99_9BACT|nr:MAG: fructose-1,6-bisphosphate aldolase, class II [Candidatus Uhrbacteria bacterium CG_4_9_14_3_um_filter_36_7]